MPKPQKERRVTIDLSPQAAGEIDRIKAMLGNTTADIFRHSFSLYRLYVDAKAKGKTMCIIEKDQTLTRIELPMIF